MEENWWKNFFGSKEKYKRLSDCKKVVPMDRWEPKNFNDTVPNQSSERIKAAIAAPNMTLKITPGLLKIVR